VMDTKWKLLDTQQNNGSGKYDISQGDMYQMFAYGQKYLGGKGTLVLIYPKSETFQESIKLPFVFSDDGEAKLELYVVPFDVSSDMKDCERITLPIALLKQEATRGM
jgi:5-methylcytosine-specific restriction enzyme subunit McrC